MKKPKKKQRILERHMFTCLHCGPNAMATREHKCTRCWHDCVVQQVKS